MRAFFRRHRGLHIWLLSVCGVLALYFALRPVPGLMTRFSRGIIMPLERAVAAVCYRADFSVAELLYAIAAGVVLVCFGVLRGEVDTVFSKAVKLCLECVGIG